MIYIIGLGNPGEKFEQTRHNVGFIVVDFFAKKNKFPDFEVSKKDEVLVSKEGNVVLAKPDTFMNRSGLAAKKLTSKNKTADVIVIHDDIDLPLGKFKIVKNRGSAGHKGVESVMKAIGNKHLVRFRVGVQASKGKPKQPEKFVVQNFTEEEQKEIKKTVKKIAEALDYVIVHGLENAMNTYNRSAH